MSRQNLPSKFAPSADHAVEMLSDTDVLIWYFRGHVRAAATIRETVQRQVSVVSVMELYAGARDRQELAQIKIALRDLDFEIAALNAEIGERAAVLMEKLTLGAGLMPADALIAATALELRQPLITANRKHFAIVPGLMLQLFQPN
jgi:predicted nucleic acid-binding protein